MARKSKAEKARRAAARAAGAGQGKVRAGLAGAAEKVTEALVGEANQAVAPGAFQQIFRYSQLATGTAGTDRTIGEIWATFLDDVGTQGVPPETITRLNNLGAESVLGSSGFPDSITEALDKNTLKTVKESHRLARAALKGVPEGSLKLSWNELLDEFAKDADFADDNGKRLIAKLRKVNPNVVAKVGSNQVLSVVARRGEDPFWIRQFNKLFKRQNTAVLPRKFVSFLEQTNKGVIPKVAPATLKALAKGGGEGLAAGFGTKAVGLLGKGALGAGLTGVFLGLEAKRAVDILGRSGRADKLALQGFQAIGPSSSVDFLRNTVNQQELIARRQLVMQKFEPELFQEVIRALGSTDRQAGSLTQTERRIGAQEAIGAQPTGRTKKDVKFLLDQLFSQMGPGGPQ